MVRLSCCSRGRVLAALAVVLAVVARAMYNAAVAVGELQEPFPAEDALPGTARYYCGRPSDGQCLQWYHYGSDRSNARVWVLVHGAVSTGGVFGIFPGFEQRLRDLNVRVVAPTMPGWGASHAYTPVFAMTGGAWLEQWTRDAMALVDHLGIDTFVVSGMSLGAPPALTLAASAATQRRLLGMATLIGNMWNHPGYDILATISYTIGERVAIAALQNTYIAAACAVLMRTLILGTTDWSANPMVPPDVTWDRQGWGRDMQHSLRHQMAGHVQSHRLAFVPSPSPLVNWSAFDDSLPVHVFYGNADTVCPPQMAMYTATKLPWAVRVEFEGTHFHLDMLQVLDALFESQQRPT